MKFKELLDHSALIDALLQTAPASQFSGKPLTLTSICDGLGLVWENCMEKDWWVGANDGIYTRQDRRTVTDEEIIAAAEKAGIDAGDIASAFVSRVQEMAALDDARNASAANWSKEQADASEQRGVAARQRTGESRPELLDAAAAAAAEKELAELFKNFPAIDRMTRKGDMVDAAGVKLATFTNRAGMLAWLFQNGFRATIDDRNLFVDSQK